MLFLCAWRRTPAQDALGSPILKAKLFPTAATPFWLPTGGVCEQFSRADSVTVSDGCGSLRGRGRDTSTVPPEPTSSWPSAPRKGEPPSALMEPPVTDLAGGLQGWVLSEPQSPGGEFSAPLQPDVVSPVKPTAGLMLENKKKCHCYFFPVLFHHGPNHFC